MRNNNFFKKIDEFFDWLILIRPEKRQILKNIKKNCKKHFVRKEFLEMYLNIQKRILDRVNDPPKEKNKPIINFQKESCVSLMKGRLFELSQEFSIAVRKEMFHSANALTRQIIEIYLITSYLIYDEEYCNVLIGEKEGYFPRFKKIIEDLNKKSIWPNIKNVTKENYFKGVEADYNFYSGFFHPKQDSFIQNIWVADKSLNGNYMNTRSYKEKTKDSIIFLFPKKTPWIPDYVKRMIHVFYTYAGFSLNFLEKLEGKNEI